MTASPRSSSTSSSSSATTSAPRSRRRRPTATPSSSCGSSRRSGSSTTFARRGGSPHGGARSRAPDGASPGQQGRILVSAGIHAMHVRDTASGARVLRRGAAAVPRGRRCARRGAGRCERRDRAEPAGRDARSITRAERALEGFRAIGALGAEGQILANLAQSYETPVTSRRPGGISPSPSTCSTGWIIRRPARSRWRCWATWPNARATSRRRHAGRSRRYGSPASSQGGVRRLRAPLRRRSRATSAAKERAAELLGASDAAFSRAVVVPQEDEAARRAGARRPLGARTGKGGRRGARPHELGGAWRCLSLA